MKLGIMGGMGPRATADFLREIYDRTEAVKDWDHLHIIVDSNVTIPSRSRSLFCNETSPVEAMKKTCRGLMSMGCNYIAVPCNSAHYFYDDVVAGDGFPWINMLEVVADELRRFNKVLILGSYVTIIKRVYDKYINAVYLDDYTNVFNLVEKLKQNLSVDMSAVNAAIDSTDADCILMACTELPLVMEEQVRNDKTVVSGNRIYVEHLIRKCGYNVKKTRANINVLEKQGRLS